jgi:putative hemolysin
MVAAARPIGTAGCVPPPCDVTFGPAEGVPRGASRDAKLEPASPPEPVLHALLAILPAIIAALFGTASAAVSALSTARKAALRETLDGRDRVALDRYMARGPEVESRWLVLRVLGIASSALLIGRQLPLGLDGWLPVIAALCALAAYGVPVEILKALVLRSPERSAVLLLRYLRPIELLVVPIARPLSMIGKLVGRSGVRPKSLPPPPRVTETEVELIVNEGEQNGSLDHERSEMIRNVLDFKSLSAGDVMVPRTRVKGIDIETPASELLKLIQDAGHSRYPVYRERVDNVVGILHAKDLLGYVAQHGTLDGLSLQRLLRTPVAFVPDMQSASSVLKDMRAGRHHLAIVVDEFGSVLGIVTLEDLVEEIVGDIRDEYDVEEPAIVELEDGRLMVDASVSISDLSRYLGAELPESSDYHTLGGFIVDRLGRVPRVGAKLGALGLEFVVRDADDRHVAKVEIVRSARRSSISAA